MSDIERVFAGFGRLRLVALYSPRSSCPVNLARLASACMTDVLVQESDHFHSGLVECIRRFVCEPIASAILREARIVVAPDMELLLHRALRLSSKPCSVEQLSRAAKTPERSLRYYCEQRGFMTPRRLLGWCRVLYVAFLLEDRARTVESIAELLEYPSPTALRNQLHDYTQLTATQLREMGPLSTVARRFELSALTRRTASRL